MSFLSWLRNESSAASSPRLREALTRVLAFLRAQPAGQEIVPSIVAKAIHETEPVALTALRILTRQGITQEHLGLYCGERDVPLKSFDRAEDVPSVVTCRDCDEEHDTRTDEAKMSVYYTVNRDALQRKFAEYALG